MYAPPKKKGPRRNLPQHTGKLRLRVGDTVRVIAGKDKGKEGKITQVMPSEGKVLIEGINIVVKHQKPRQTAAGVPAQGGGRIEQAAPLWACKVQLVDPGDGSRVTRIGIRTNADGSRVRIARKSGGLIDNG
jgi:large subunit ribosomal protein L24